MPMRTDVGSDVKPLICLSGPTRVTHRPTSGPTWDPALPSGSPARNTSADIGSDMKNPPWHVGSHMVTYHPTSGPTWNPISPSGSLPGNTSADIGSDMTPLRLPTSSKHIGRHRVRHDQPLPPHFLQTHRPTSGPTWTPNSPWNVGPDMGTDQPTSCPT